VLFSEHPKALRAISGIKKRLLSRFFLNTAMLAVESERDDAG
jgi:hypothetical protein